MRLHPLTEDPSSKTLLKVKSNKSCGPDLLSPPLLKVCAHQLRTPLSKSFITYLATATILRWWKPASLRPIPKRGTGKCRPTRFSLGSSEGVLEAVFCGTLTVLSRFTLLFYTSKIPYSLISFFSLILIMFFSTVLTMSMTVLAICKII